MSKTISLICVFSSINGTPIFSQVVFKNYESKNSHPGLILTHKMSNFLG